MKKGIVVLVALIITIAIQAELPVCEYLFLNVSGAFSPGYVFIITNKNNGVLRVLKKGDWAFLASGSIYGILAAKGNSVIDKIFYTPDPCRPFFEPDKPIITIDFGRFLEDGFTINQYTYQEAKNLYGDRFDILNS